jgi:hypothetical protein
MEPQAGFEPCVAQAGLELKILLYQPPEGWDYRQETPGSFISYII